MSDLFKDHKPELSEEEDRLLWQRVRAIPALETAPAFRPAPWWRKLWEMPGVRYGAPALAVLMAAVVWVVAREPEYKADARRARQEASSAKQTPAPVTDAQPAPTRNSARVMAVDEKVATKPVDGVGIPTKDKAEGAEWRADAVAPAEPQNEELASRPASAAPTAGALRKSAPAPAPSTPTATTGTTFAAPPPATATSERKQSASAPAPQAQELKAAEKPQWGGVKSNYRDGGNTAQVDGIHPVSAPDMLLQGSLPDPSTLATHPVVQAASPTAYAKAAMVTLPIDIATQADLKAGARPYEDFAPAEQAAAIAYAFERALANPSATPRARIERMLAHAKAIEDRSGKADKVGASMLVAMIEGALEAWP